MLGLIFGIIFFIAGIALGAVLFFRTDTIYEEDCRGFYKTDSSGNRIGKKTHPTRKFSVVAFAAGTAVAIILVWLGCIASVPSGHTGVLTTFGRVENDTLDAGLNVKAPWQKVVVFDNRVQKSTTNLSCFSSDIQEVTISYSLNYQIDKSTSLEIYKNIGSAYYDAVVAPNIAEAVKVITARYTAEQLIESRSELVAAIEDFLSDRLSAYKISVVSTAIEDMDFTEAFTNAVEAKQVAAQHKLQAEIEQAQKVMEQEATAKMAIIKANADAETARIQAEADLEVVKIQADAAEYAGQKDAAINKAIADSLTEALLRYYYVEQWDGKLPDTYVGSEDVGIIIDGTTYAE